MDYIQLSLFGKTSSVLFQAQQGTKEQISEPFFKKYAQSPTTPYQFLCLKNADGKKQEKSWETHIPLRGVHSVQVTGESPKEGAESILSHVLMANVPGKYSLSARACQGILRRALNREKDLPRLLKNVLERQAGLSNETLQSSTNITAGFNGHKSITGNICYKEESSPCIETKMPPNVIALEYHPSDSRIKIDNSGIIQTLTARMGTGGGNVPLVLDCRNYTINSEISGTPQAKDNGGYSLNYINPVMTFAKQSYSEYVESDVGKSILASDDVTTSDLIISSDYIARRLTPTECARLQGFPDWWCADIPHSDSAEYRMWGNGVALPPTLYVMQGVAEALNCEQEGD